MTMTAAILCDFPLRLIDAATSAADPEAARREGIYPVWLVTLAEAFATSFPGKAHWISATKLLRRYRRIEWKNQTFHLIPRSKMKAGLLSAYAMDRFRVGRLLRELKPDVVHAWGTEDLYALAAADFRGPSLVSIQGYLAAYAARGPITRFERMQRFWEHLALRQLGVVTAESPWAAEQLRRRYPEKRIEIIDYGVERPFFSLKRNPASQPVFLYAGRLQPIKGSDTLIEAFSDPRLAGMELRLAGFGHTLDLYRRRLTPNIKPLGPLARDALRREFENAWCLVHPSLADTGPTVVKEARVAGLPVIVSEDCGSKQYVEQGKSGFVVSPGDKEALIDAVLNMASSREKASSMGMFGRDECRDRLRPERTAENFLQLYRSLLSGGSPCY